MDQYMGRQPVAKLAQWLDAYEVSGIDGANGLDLWAYLREVLARINPRPSHR